MKSRAKPSKQDGVPWVVWRLVLCQVINFFVLSGLIWMVCRAGDFSGVMVSNGGRASVSGLDGVIFFAIIFYLVQMESIDLIKEMISLVKSRTLKYYVIAVSGVFLLLVAGNKTAGGGIYFALLLTYLVSLWLMLKRGMINAAVVRFSILCNFLLSIQRIQIDLIETNYIFKRRFDWVSDFMVVGRNVVEMLAVIFILCFGVYVGVASKREEREGRLPGVG